MKRSKTLLKVLTAFTFCGAVTFTSCKKDNNLSDDAQVAATLEVSANDAEAEEQYDDVFNIAMGVKSSDVGEDIGLGEGIGLYGRTNVTTSDLDRTASPDTGRCFTVTVTPQQVGAFPKTVTTNFGTGCLGRDGKLRKGKIVTVYTGPMFVPGKKATTTFVDYFVDTFRIEGTHTVENTSTSNQQGWSVKVVGGKITNTVSGRWRKWDSEKNILQTEGNATALFPADDVFKVSGHANGSNSLGHIWTAISNEPLVKKFICHWIVKGTVTITRDGNTAILDYGNGSCDNQATITVNGTPHVITLH